MSPKIIGWGWYYLSTVLDDFSRYIISWRPTTNMAAEDVTMTLGDALEKTGVEQVKVVHQPSSQPTGPFAKNPHLY